MPYFMFCYLFRNSIQKNLGDKYLPVTVETICSAGNLINYFFCPFYRERFCIYVHFDIIPDSNILCKLLVPIQETPVYNHTPILV